MRADQDIANQQRQHAIRGRSAAFRLWWTALMSGFALCIGSGVGCHKSQPNLVYPSTPSFLMPYTPGAELKIGPPPTIPNPTAGANAASAAPSSNPFSAFTSPTAASNPAATAAATTQMAELERKARLLDDNNQQLTTQLAQAQQQTQLYKDRSDLMQRQLADVSNQLDSARVAATRTLPTMTIAMAPPPIIASPAPVAATPKATPTDSTRRSSARLTANVSSAPNDRGLNGLGYDVVEQGGTVRLRIPSDQLFQSGTAQLTPSAAGILDRVAAIIQKEYPMQRVSIEGHTDNAPLYGGTYTTSHQLASAQTSTIFEQWTRRNQMPPSQLVTLAHGSNYPIQDNQSPAGRAVNRRIEFVISSETY